MKRNTATQKVPSTREESLNMIIREFLDSDERQIRLVLYPQEIPILEKQFPEIVVLYKNIYHPDDDFSIFFISKRETSHLT